MPTLQIRRDVVYREIDGLIVAFSLETGEYVALDEIGTEMWRLIADDGRLAAVRARLLADYDITEEACDDELGAFVGMLEARKLISRRDQE